MYTRRNFLSSLPGLGLGTLGVTNTLLNLKMINTGLAADVPDSSDYRAIVCVFQGGGNDSFNTLIPTSPSEYSNYQALRSNVALPLTGTLPIPGTASLIQPILPLNVNNTPGRTFGINSAMPNLQRIFNDGDAAFLANVGALIEPITPQQVRDGTIPVPRALGSHNDQSTTWQTSIADTTGSSGWAGRLADRVMANNPSNQLSMNISLSGNQIMLSGQSAFGYSIETDGAQILGGNGSLSALDQMRVDTARTLIQQQQSNILRSAFARESGRAYDSAEFFSNAFNATNAPVSFTNNGLSNQFSAVARTIAARETLGHRRQIFFVSHPRYDAHATLLQDHQARMTELDTSLSEFWDELGVLGVRDQVTTFTCSEFARTIRSNGLGTDHAWGGNMIMMGGSVNGGSIYGEFPDESQLALGSGLDAGTNGRFVPTTSVDEYFAELALWLGLPGSELDNVFPTLSNFYTHSPGECPIGFLA